MDDLDKRAHHGRRRTEKWFYDTVLRRQVPGHWQRVENVCDRGTPDTHYAGKYVSPEYNIPIQGWLELKIAHNIVKANKPVKLVFRKGQLAWLTECAHHGGVCGVAAYLDRPLEKYKDVLLVGGALLGEVLRLPYEALDDSPYARVCSQQELTKVLPEFLYSLYQLQHKRVNGTLGTLGTPGPGHVRIQV